MVTVIMHINDKIKFILQQNPAPAPKKSKMKSAEQIQN